VRGSNLNHEIFMRECFRLALEGRGHVSPNPLVGAVLVKQGKIVSSGWHARYGGPHAEADCLARYKGDPAGAILYVNLEPCSHFGKTPPCADLIVSAGIRRVVVAMKDPNPLVSGRGIGRLRRAGLTVDIGVCGGEARDLNRFFVKNVTAKRPYVHLKIAQSLDGIIAGTSARRRWISSKESRRIVHAWRATHDAVLVGAGTIHADNPRLNVRLASWRDPEVVILDGRLTVPAGAKVFMEKRRVVVVAARRHALKQQAHVRKLQSLGVTVIAMGGEGGSLSLGAVLKRLYALNIGSLLVEGGGSVFAQFMKAGLVDELSIFIAPLYLGGGSPAFARGVPLLGRGHPFKPRTFSAQTVGSDILLKSFV
jgi:diaminohydroxyphosphoribosylaminopyrimidine deaminase/5-amino-6-(5-phosphoribosylamino)uracil reductase